MATSSFADRIKTMILSANGQNIFPEEIESILNNMPFVHESLVIERDKKLVALVNPDSEAARSTRLEPSRHTENHYG
jgi:long-chain acyl-CoA synthetase